jgi:hypothetical protein
VWTITSFNCVILYFPSSGMIKYDALWLSFFRRRKNTQQREWKVLLYGDHIFSCYVLCDFTCFSGLDTCNQCCKLKALDFYSEVTGSHLFYWFPSVPRSKCRSSISIRPRSLSYTFFQSLIITIPFRHSLRCWHHRKINNYMQYIGKAILVTGRGGP